MNKKLQVAAHRAKCQQKNISDLIYEIRQEIQSNNTEILTAKLEELKTNMKDLIAAKASNDSNSDPMSSLNDL